MKRYALVLAAILVVIALFGLPPRPYVNSWWFRTQHRTPERAAFLEIQEDLVLENWLYQRIQWRDSVASALEAVDPAVTPFVLSLPEWGRDSARVLLEEGVRRQLEYLDVQQPKVPIGVFFIPRDLHAHPSAPPDRYGFRWAQREIYVARDGEAPFCALLEPVAVEGGYNGLNNTVKRLVVLPKDPLSVPNTLRICGYYARYGVPGPEIESWLRGGGASLAAGSNMYRRSLLIAQMGRVRLAFGGLGYFPRLSEIGLGCLGGVASACLKAFSGASESLSGWMANRTPLGEQTDVSPVDYYSSRWWVPGNFGGYDEYIMETLEKEFGPERFGAFWNSDLPVLDAFREAFGLPADQWVMKWARNLYGPLDRGPAVPVKASFLTFLTLGLFGALATAMAGRRS